MNTDNKDNKEKYTESSGTGVLSAVIFLLLAIIALFFLSKYFG